MLFITTSLNASCDMKRPIWGRIKGHNTRQYVLMTQGKKVVVNNKKQVISGEFSCPYSKKVLILNNKKDISKSIQIDHILPWSFYKRNAKDCKRAIEFYNDIQNLTISYSKANNKKRDSTIYDEYDAVIKVVACGTCKRYNLNNCDLICKTNILAKELSLDN